MRARTLMIAVRFDTLEHLGVDGRVSPLSLAACLFETDRDEDGVYSVNTGGLIDPATVVAAWWVE